MPCGHPFLSSTAALLLPRACLICGSALPGVASPTTWESLCPTCAAQLRQMGDHTCTRCGVPVYGAASGERTCSVCRQTPPVWGKYLGLLRYAGPARTWVKDFKYRQSFYLEKDFFRLLNFFRPTLANFFADALLVPVPLHPLKKSLRGFNQAEKFCYYLQKTLAPQPSPLLATSASPLHPLPSSPVSTPPADLQALTNPPSILPLLRRTRWTPPQASLRRADRLSNVKNAFDINPAIALECLQSRRIVIIDDLLTTGSTLSACVDVLHQAGFTKVDVFTLARA